MFKASVNLNVSMCNIQNAHLKLELSLRNNKEVRIKERLQFI